MTDKDKIFKIAEYAGLKPELLDRELVELIKEIDRQFPNHSLGYKGAELRIRLDPCTAMGYR